MTSNNKYTFSMFKDQEVSRNLYHSPIPKGVEVRGIIYESESYSGVFAGAEDHLVELGMPVLAMLDGKVIQAVDCYANFGNDPKYGSYLNFITIKHFNDEFSQYGHLARGSALVQEGERVVAGQQIAITGMNGYMSEPHLHVLFFKREDNEKGFQGLKIRYQERDIDLC